MKYSYVLQDIFNKNRVLLTGYSIKGKKRYLNNHNLPSDHSLSLNKNHVLIVIIYMHQAPSK